MFELTTKQVLVIGLGEQGQAACELLCRHGARVVAMDRADTPELQPRAEQLRALGAQVSLGVRDLSLPHFDLAVLSQGVSSCALLVQAVLARGVPLISDLELGFQQTQCLSIGIAGTNGKSTTAGLVERLLANNHRKTVIAGHCARPVCAVADQTRDLDFLILQLDSFELEWTEFFRPAVGVLLNLAPAQAERDSSPADYARANAQWFRHQQAFDWAIVQSDALARLRELELPVPAKTITFSATDATADLHLDRGLILSRLPNWSGPLLDLDHCQLRGPHNAENLMAALAVGHALRLPLENMVDSLKTFTAGPHRFQLVGEINGVQFINDSKATSLDAMQKAVLGTRPGPRGEANVWLIAGGRDQAGSFHDAGPVLSQRVKRALLLGEAGEKIRAAWSLFTPCTLAGSLLEAVAEAAKNATSGDVVLLSPACLEPGSVSELSASRRGLLPRSEINRLGCPPGQPQYAWSNRANLKNRLNDKLKL